MKKYLTLRNFIPVFLQLIVLRNKRESRNGKEHKDLIFHSTVSTTIGMVS